MINSFLTERGFIKSLLWFQHVEEYYIKMPQIIYEVIYMNYKLVGKDWGAQL